MNLLRKSSSNRVSLSTYLKNLKSYRSHNRFFSNDVFAVLNELRLDALLCDVTIRLDDTTEFPIHSVVLAASSRYFRALFTSGMKDTGSTMVHLAELDSDIANCLIEWCYTRKTLISSDNIERLLPAADKYQLLGLLDACSEYLKRNLTSDNVIGILKFSSFYFNYSLKSISRTYLMKNFLEIMELSREILEISSHEFKTIINADDLNVKHEERIFDAVVKYVSFKKSERADFIVELLKCIRIGLMKPEVYILAIRKHPYIIENIECKRFILESLRVIYGLNTERSYGLDNYILTPRIPHEIIFAVGGWSGGHPSDIIETYDCRMDKWTLFESIHCDQRAYHGCVELNNLIYIIGGYDGHEYFNSCKCFNPRLRAWRIIAPMHSKRCYVSVVSLNGNIYALGGFNGEIRQDTAEKYSPETNQWLLISRMKHQRSDASAAVLNGKIYICGGFDGQECLNTVEYYTPETDTWTLLTPMNSRRSGISVVSFNSYLYAIGGFNGIIRLNSVEKYDTAKNVWEPVANMVNPRSNFSSQVLNDAIYVFGGFNGVTTMFFTEMYNQEDNEWVRVSNMNLIRNALSSCVLSGLNEVRSYILEGRKSCLTSSPTDSSQTLCLCPNSQ